MTSSFQVIGLLTAATLLENCAFLVYLDSKLWSCWGAKWHSIHSRPWCDKLPSSMFYITLWYLGSLVTSENHKVYMVSSDSFCTSCVYKGSGTMLHFCVFVQALPIHTHVHTLMQAHRSILMLKQTDIPKDKIDNWWLEGVVWLSHPSSQCLSCPRSSPVAEIQVTNYPNSVQRKTN